MLFALLRKAWQLHLPRSLRWRVLRWMAGSAIREFPWALGIGGLLAIGALAIFGWLDSAPGIVGASLLALWVAVCAWLAYASVTSARGIREALADLEPPADEQRSKFPVSNLLFPPLMLWPRGVSHHRAIEFARYGRKSLLLDVYTPTEAGGESLRPSVIQVHGGGWVAGSRREQGIPLLNHLARHGWVGFNVDYRLSPRATFPDHVVDVKRAIAWVREHARDYGADPEFVCITGGSAGGHLCALAALTANDPAFQPGFEDADTSVAAAVPFYGVYDLTNEERVYYTELRDWVLERYVFKARFADDPELFRSASPTHRVHPEAPPFLVVHGDRDTLVPVEDARRFVRELRAVAPGPTLYAELAGAEHAFDILPSVRTARMVEAIERFLASVHADRGAVAPARSIG